MDIQNVSGDALTKIGVTIPAGGTKTGLDDKWLQDEDIAALVTGGKLVATNFNTDAGSAVVQPEVSAAVAASHTHANQAELDLVTDGDHDVIVTGNPHAVALSDLAYTAGTAGDWAGTPPADVAAALDRLAAQLAITSAAPIP